MPASPPREAFRGGRGRGRPRGNSKLNDAKSDIGGTYSGRRGLPSTTVSSESSTKYKPLPKQAGFRNKSWRNDATSSTKPRIRTNGSNQFVSSKSSKSEEQPWRNPVNETNNAYQKHMSDLYQKVCASFP